MNVTFRGGVHPAERKELSREAALREFNPTGEMVFPLAQHIGKPAKAVVKKGDTVLVGQCIAQADGFVSANIICSCSGTVKAVEKRRVLSGAMADCIVVDNDGKFTKAEGIGKKQDVSKLKNEEILAKVKDAGIIGLGGAGFPTHVKLAPKDPSAIKWLIANGAECEPYLTCNDQLMRSKAAEIVQGMELLLRLYPNARGVICIEDNKPEAVLAMQKAAEGKDNIKVRALQTKYPQGGERSLIKVIAGVDFPINKLPADVGCIVCNVGTIYAVQQMLVWNEPLYTHVLTVTGEAVKEPANFIVRDGTAFSELIDACGGIKDGVELKKILCGGPMMGFAACGIDVPVQKATNALTLLSEDGTEKAEKIMTPCLRCGRCSVVCPTGLVPSLMAMAVEFNDPDRYEKKLHGLECIACGSCTYICPAKRPLTQIFRQTKAEIMARKRAAAAGGAK